MSAAPEPSALPPVTPTDPVIDVAAGFLPGTVPPTEHERWQIRRALEVTFPILLASYLGVPGASPAEALHQLARLIAANAKASASREAVREWVDGLTPEQIHDLVHAGADIVCANPTCRLETTPEYFKSALRALAGLAGEGQGR